MVPALEPDRPEAPLAETDIHHVLSNQRRRLVLDLLAETDDGELTARELSELIAEKETGESPPPRNIRQSAYVSLHQTHLPKMEEFGIVAYDDAAKTVSLTDSASQVNVYMETVPRYGISWSEFYCLAACLGLLLVAASAIGVPALSAVGSLNWAVAVLVLIGGAATYQTAQQGSSILHRIGTDAE
mgnify:CR=1 FL=1